MDYPQQHQQHQQHQHPREGDEPMRQASPVGPSREQKPTFIPMTITLRDGLPKREVQIMHPLRVGTNSDIAKQQAQHLAKETQGDQSYIYKQLDRMNKMFKDADRRTMDPELIVLTLIVPLGDDKSYCLFHRCLWDLSTPLAMVDVYCQEVICDIGLGSSVAHALCMHMQSLVEDSRKSEEKVANTIVRTGPDILLQKNARSHERIRFPVVLKRIEDAERLKKVLQDVDYGMEGDVLCATMDEMTAVDGRY